MSDPADFHWVSELPLEAMVACHECDLLMLKPQLQSGESAECPRCGYELYRHRHQVVRRSLALVIAALLLYIPANFLFRQMLWRYRIKQSMSRRGNCWDKAPMERFSEV